GRDPLTCEGPNQETTRKSGTGNLNDMERQTSSRRPAQLQFDLEGRGEADHGSGSEAVSGTAGQVVGQVSLAEEGTRAWEQELMERVADEANLVEALRRVCANKGSAGIDQMSVAELRAWMSQRTHRAELRERLISGSYQPALVRGVQIPKPGGKGVRQLGIPTAMDRLVEQAMLQVLEPLFDPYFSESSFWFRPGRGAHDALRQASEYVAQGRSIVADLDLEKFFDRVQHDVLMVRVARRVKDKRVLALIGRFLRAGMMQNGVCVRREEGTPQGGPLSPLLANILLDDLDKELEKRGHRFCRYADDCNIYLKSERAGQRVMASVTDFLERKLKLMVNKAKSAVAKPKARKFLGQRVLGGREHTYLGIHPKSVQRAKKKARLITKRNRGVSFGQVIRELGRFTDGWVVYHRHARCSSLLKGLDEWLRRRLRCYRWKQWKTWRNRAEQMRKLGV